MVLAALGALAGCEPYVQGNGVYREEFRNVRAFEGVSAQDGIQVQITAAAAQQSVKVSGDENVVQHIVTDVQDDPQRGFPVLTVKSSIASFDSVNPVAAVIAVATLQYVAATHACTVGAAQVASPSFEVDADDNASVTLSGAGGASLVARLGGGQRGGAQLVATRYPVDTATVALTGGASTELAVRVSVTGTADGGSTVENTGAAICTVATTGGSKVSCAP